MVTADDTLYSLKRTQILGAIKELLFHKHYASKGSYKNIDSYLLEEINMRRMSVIIPIEFSSEMKIEIYWHEIEDRINYNLTGRRATKEIGLSASVKKRFVLEEG